MTCMEIFPDTLLCCSPEKYVLKFATGTLPKESKKYIIDYQFSDGSVRKDVPVEILGPDVLLVYHPAIKKPGKFTATLHPTGNKTVKCASYNMRILSPMEYIYKKVFCPSSRNQDSLFSLDPKATNAFFAAVLAYYSNIDCNADHANIDIMVHNLLHSFDTFCGDNKHWNIAAITTGMFGSQENLLHLSLRRRFESSASYLVNTFLNRYEHVLLEKARNDDTAAELANKSGLKTLEAQIRRKTVDLQQYEVINVVPSSSKDKENDYQALMFSSPAPVVPNTFSANEALDEGQVDFIQTLKRSTISVATAISDYTPSGGVGCIPVKKGELVHIIKVRENGWCFGVATDRYGYFPASSVKMDLDLGYASGSGTIEGPNKTAPIPYYATSATESKGSKTLVTLLDESKTTGIPSLEALKARSQYQAKILEYYQVSYLSPLSSPKVELKAGDFVDVLEEVDSNWCRAIYKSFICLIPKTILTTDLEDAYVFMNLDDICTPVIQRNAKKKGQIPKSKSLKEKTTTEKPDKGNDVVDNNKASTLQAAPVSPAIKKPVRKAPPPPSSAATPATAVSGNQDQMSPTSPAENHNQNSLDSPVFVRESTPSSNTVKPPITSPKPKFIKKSVSIDKLPFPPAGETSGGKVPPKPPTRGSSLINEVDETSWRHSSFEDSDASRAAKPVPKKRTKSVHH